MNASNKLINNPMNAVELVSFDNDIQTWGMTDEEIVGSVCSIDV